MVSFKHFLSTKNLSRSEILALLSQAQAWLSTDPTAFLKNKIVANLFFENSTRTRCSFEIAAQKLGGYMLNFDVDTSSTQKGETLMDTVRNLAAMGVDIFVIRHPESGFPAQIANSLGSYPAVVNAGDGKNEHPTQAMLDILTIYQYKRDFSPLIITFIGDIRHSRVARSLSFALHTLGVAEIRFVAPVALMPDSTEDLPPTVKFHHNLEEGVKDADVMITLRVQHERIDTEETLFNVKDYIRDYRLNTRLLEYAKRDAIVMHPGPVNRGVEIESAVADGQQSVILEQPRLGVLMRMAILKSCVACHT